MPAAKISSGSSARSARSSRDALSFRMLRIGIGAVRDRAVADDSRFIASACCASARRSAPRIRALKPLFGKAHCVAPARVGVDRHGFEPRRLRDDRGRRLRVEQHAGRLRGIDVANRFARSAAAKRDDRRARTPAPRPARCRSPRPRRTRMRALAARTSAVAASPRRPANSTLARRVAREALPLGAVADDRQPAVGHPRECVDDHVDALVRNEPRNRHVAAARSACATLRKRSTSTGG